MRQERIITMTEVPKFISFRPLREIGFEFDLEEFFTKGKKRIKVKESRCKGRVVNKEVCKKMLYNLGLDTYNHPWWIEPKTKHRNGDSPEEIYDYRYAGYERLDKEWIESGRASLEAHLASSKMQDMGEKETSYVLDVKDFDKVDSYE